MTKFCTKVAKCTVTFWASVKSTTFHLITAVSAFWPTSGGFGQLFISASGHTGRYLHLKGSEGSGLRHFREKHFPKWHLFNFLIHLRLHGKVGLYLAYDWLKDKRWRPTCCWLRWRVHEHWCPEIRVGIFMFSITFSNRKFLFTIFKKSKPVKSKHLQ